MNLPNKLTVLRVILIVPFVVCMLVPSLGETGMYAAVAIFIIASLTDLLDGKIARKYNLVTNFGKFMDPLADKLLVCAAMICLVASDNGIVIAASYWGKFKTTFQMVMIVMLILNFDNVIYQICALIVTHAALILTVISLIDYVVKNKAVLREQK